MQKILLLSLVKTDEDLRISQCLETPLLVILQPPQCDLPCCWSSCACLSLSVASYRGVIQRMLPKDATRRVFNTTMATLPTDLPESLRPNLMNALYGPLVVESASIQAQYHHQGWSYVSFRGFQHGSKYQQIHCDQGSGLTSVVPFELFVSTSNAV